MAVALADGILGLEARWKWTPAVGAAYWLNDRSAWPYVHLKRIDGLFALPELDDQRSPNVNRIGEAEFPSIEGGRTIILEGEVRAKSLQSLRYHAHLLRLAFARGLAEGRMDVIPSTSYVTLGGGETIDDYTWYFNAKRLTFEMGDEQTRGPSNVLRFSRTFQLTLRLADPRYYHHIEQESTGNASASSTNLENSGSAPTDPTILVVGALTDVDIVNGTTGELLHFQGLGYTGTLVVDYRTRRAWRQSNGENMIAKLNVSLSSAWDRGSLGLQPGANNFGVTGGVWDAYWHHAAW